MRMFILLLTAAFILATPFGVALAEIYQPPLEGTVIGILINLRSGPGLNEPVIANVSGRVQVVEGQGDWYRIAAGDQKGWIRENYLLVQMQLPEPSLPGDDGSEIQLPEPLEPEEGELLEEPAEDDQLSVPIRDIRFSGNEVISTEELEAIAKDFEGRDLTLEEMSELVDLITITYQERGFILARAYLPKQDIQDGVLEIAVMEGNIGEFKVSGDSVYADNVIKRYFKGQLEDGVVKEEALEKALVLTNELPDVKTGVVLQRGEKPGDVDVVVDAKDTGWLTAGINLSLDYNNYGSPLTSQNRFGATMDIVEHRFGSKLYLRGVMGDNVEDAALFLGTYTIPVLQYGTSIELGYLRGNFLVGQNLADLGFDGDTQIYGAKLTHPFIAKRNRSLKFTLGYDHKNSKTKIQEEVTNIDELDAGFITIDYESLDRYLGKNLFSFSSVFGKLNLVQDKPPTRQNPSEHYERLTLSALRIQKLFGYNNLILRGTGQYTNDRLVAIETFVIGGYGSVRGFDPATFLGDSGYTLSAEINFAPPGLTEKMIFNQKVGQVIQLAAFYDYWAVFTNDPLPGERTQSHLDGYGLGLRLFYKKRVTFKYDYAIPVRRVQDQPSAINYFLISLNLF